LLVASSAAAQKRTTIGFETDCTRGATPGNFVGGYKQVSGSLYASCGVASMASGGLTGAQQLAQSGALSTIPGVTGTVALAGAFTSGSAPGLTFGDVVIVFSPAVNEVSFDALDLNNASGLRVTLTGPGNVPIAATPVEMPAATNGTVHYVRKSAQPIERLTISYQSSGIADGWFVDQLSFNTWTCGDGELENDDLNPSKEACDDGNRVQCDGCGNTCQATTIGCFGAGTCVAPGATAGCSSCDMATPAGADGNIPTTPRPVMTVCDDGLFCTTGDACDGAGVCVALPNTCADGVVCTVDSCNETMKLCLHTIEDKWCLIAGGCVATGAFNPANKCELCSSAKNNSAWDKQPAGSQCGDPTCSNGVGSAMLTAAASCDANGACLPGATSTCQFPQCATGASCDGLCTGDQNCVEQAHCVVTTKACVPDLPKATACARNAECASGHCVDGVCCDKVCNSACESCNQQNLVGTCTPLPNKVIDPQNLCPSGQYCAEDGKCTAEVPTVPVVVVTPPTVVDIRPMGTGCMDNSVCGSAVCKDGVCCDRACEGVCESCNVPGQPPGQCLPFALGDDPDHECTAAGAVCSGESACTSYETRGNGLCTVSLGGARPKLPLALFGLLSVALTSLRVKRRRAR
jgi:cysteine-rich repeat protein